MACRQCQSERARSGRDIGVRADSPSPGPLPLARATPPRSLIGLDGTPD